MPEVFWTALTLGLTSFGGPIAHLGYFEQTYVRRLHWLTSEEYVELVADDRDGGSRGLPVRVRDRDGVRAGRGADSRDVKRDMRRVVEPGGFTVWVGTSSEATLEGHFTVTGGVTVLSQAPPRFR